MRKPRLLLALALTSIAPLALAGTIVYYHNDLSGSPIAATNESGQVIWRESYRPYGERLTNDPDSATNKIWFTSRSQDAATGLVYMGARWYDPMVGRFVSTDPKGFDEQNLHSFNRYAYANNNPLKFVDPDGKVPVPLIFWAAVKGAMAWGGAGFLATSSADAVSQAAAFGNVDWKGAGQEGLAAAPGWALAGAANEALSAGLAARAAATSDLGKAISEGHAFGKHVVETGNFRSLGITTREGFAKHIDQVVAGARGQDVRQLSAGRTAYWDEGTGTVVIRNPSAPDMGTAFQPATGRKYFEGLK